MTRTIFAGLVLAFIAVALAGAAVIVTIAPRDAAPLCAPHGRPPCATR